jgi:hypothetical protein
MQILFEIFHESGWNWKRIALEPVPFREILLEIIKRDKQA